MRMSKTLAAVVIFGAGLAGCAGPNAQIQQRDERTTELLTEAEQFLDEGLSDSALAAFGLALEENPDLTDAHVGMGNIFRERGDYELASRAYERAIDIEPNSFDANYNLALVRQLMGQVELAVRTYLKALTIDPESLEANRDLASAYLQLGRAGESLPYAQKATKLNPDDQAAWCNLAAVYSLQGQYEKAIDAYRQAAELGELAEPVLLGFADAHIRLGNYQRAINVLEAMVRNSTTSTAYERMGLAKFKMRKFDEALTNYRKAVEIDDTDTAALNGVGVCLMTRYLQEDREDPTLREQAVAAWRQSIKLRPDQPRIIDLLARFGRQ